MGPTCSQIARRAACTGRWSRPPYQYETCVPGVFAVGDLRSRSVKRVASAVGEGSVVIQHVHEYLSDEVEPLRIAPGSSAGRKVWPRHERVPGQATDRGLGAGDPCRDRLPRCTCRRLLAARHRRLRAVRRAGGAALDNEDVRAEIGRRAAERIVAAEPDLIAVQPVIEGVVTGIAGQGAFQGLFRSAVRDLHRAVFDRDVNTLTLTLVDIGTTIRGTLVAADPKLAKKIPPGIETTILDSEPTGAGRPGQGHREGQWLPLALLLIGLISAFAATRIAPDARRATVTLGVSIALGAALALVGMRAAEAIVLTAIDDQGARDAAAGIWDA